jgi:hypothetical protein
MGLLDLLVEGVVDRLSIPFELVLHLLVLKGGVLLGVELVGEEADEDEGQVEANEDDDNGAFSVGVGGRLLLLALDATEPVDGLEDGGGDEIEEKANRDHGEEDLDDDALGRNVRALAEYVAEVAEGVSRLLNY